MNWNRVFVHRSIPRLVQVKVFVRKNANTINILYPSLAWSSWSSNSSSLGHSSFFNQSRAYSSKSYNSNSHRIESYFAAIGGESEKPPSDLTPNQVSKILLNYVLTHKYFR